MRTRRNCRRSNSYDIDPTGSEMICASPTSAVEHQLEVRGARSADRRSDTRARRERAAETCDQSPSRIRAALWTSSRATDAPQRSLKTKSSPITRWPFGHNRVAASIDAPLHAFLPSSHRSSPSRLGDRAGSGANGKTNSPGSRALHRKIAWLPWQRPDRTGPDAASRPRGQPGCRDHPGRHGLFHGNERSGML